MEARDESLLHLGYALDGIGLDEKLLIRDRYLERAFGGTNAGAIAEAKLFAIAHGCTFTYNRVRRHGSFTRTFPARGRA